MKNNVSSLPIPALLSLAKSALDGAQTLGKTVGLALNKPALIESDLRAAEDAILAHETAIADRVAKAAGCQRSVAEVRTWCTRAKDALKPFLGERHSDLWPPAGFTQSLRIPRSALELLDLTEKLGRHLTAHPEQSNANEKFQVTASRAEEFQGALRQASVALTAHDELVATRSAERAATIQALRARLRGLVSELTQLIGREDSRWHRFGFNVPTEPETPSQPQNVQANNTSPGQLLVSCDPVPYAERYRFFIQKAGSSSEPETAGTSFEPLFRIEGEDLVSGGRYNVLVSAVNLSGREGLRSEPVTAELLARAA